MRSYLQIAQNYISCITIIGACLFASVLFVSILLLLRTFHTEETTASAITAIVNIIPAPSITSPPPTIETTKTPESTPEIAQPDHTEPVVRGALVQVSGTGGEGLRVREAPGLNSKILFLGLESEVFTVKDGPQEVDGYTWWYLAALYDESLAGWAVSDFLVVIQNP